MLSIQVNITVFAESHNCPGAFVGNGAAGVQAAVAGQKLMLGLYQIKDDDIGGGWLV